uniref:Uncharacterized protein n=2 Tax=unclassified Caudoviricetes TaxID=2788787 RepID=A0A8S5NPD8_9CAUD|nr:MAG TPA: hypothetical protein [Myoviridae sp. ctzRR1]DAD96239.1 MAG TPA: hypothetical protein [Myoviridae sp. ct0mM28]
MHIGLQTDFYWSSNRCCKGTTNFFIQQTKYEVIMLNEQDL